MLNKKFKRSLKILFINLIFMNCSANVFFEMGPKSTTIEWIDSDTIRVHSTGRALQSLPESRQEQSAEEDAVKNAVSSLMKKFNIKATNNYSDESETINANPTEYSLKSEIITAFRSGKIIYKTYNRSTGFLEIVYEVKRVKLKESLDAIK
jgi:hypothetical protein